jgi:hypothetical protein
MDLKEKILEKVSFEYNTLVLLAYKAFMGALISEIPKSEVELIEMEYLI